MSQEVIARIHLTSKVTDELGERIEKAARAGAALYKEGKVHQATLMWDKIEPLITQQVKINSRISLLQVLLK
jgi:hypothetical protein